MSELSLYSMSQQTYVFHFPIPHLQVKDLLSPSPLGRNLLLFDDSGSSSARTRYYTSSTMCVCVEALNPVANIPMLSNHHPQHIYCVCLLIWQRSLTCYLTNSRYIGKICHDKLVDIVYFLFVMVAYLFPIPQGSGEKGSSENSEETAATMLSGHYQC